jgi:hypothetical protein
MMPIRTSDLSPQRPLINLPLRCGGLVISNSLFLIAISIRAISSVVEHLLHTQEVVGSIPTSRTKHTPQMAAVYCSGG